MRPKVNLRVLYTLISAVIILAGTYVAIQYAKGNYRFTREGFAPETGLLAANSFPPGAEVVIDGRLVTATDDTIYLEPGEYTVEIIRDGYSPWKKRLQIQKELVTQTNAQLFPSAASLTPLTFTGVQNLSPSPDGQKLIYYTASTSAQTKNGLYVLELNDNPLSFQKGARQVAIDLPRLDLAQAHFIWSPDSTEIMLLTPEKEVLLTSTALNNLETLPDISFRRKQILTEWEEEMAIRQQQFLKEFPPEVLTVATQSAKNVYLSPDKKRLLYTATAAAELSSDLIPPIPAANTQPQQRALEPGGIYVYDREEDRNFRVGTEVASASAILSDVRTQGSLDGRTPSATAAAYFMSPIKRLLAPELITDLSQPAQASASSFQSLQATESAKTAQNFAVYHTSLYAQTFQWFPDSKHLIYTDEGTIRIKDYDNANDITLYSGPFLNNFVYPWPDGSRILITTSFSPNAPKNLYAIETKR